MGLRGAMKPLKPITTHRTTGNTTYTSQDGLLSSVSKSQVKHWEDRDKSEFSRPLYLCFLTAGNFRVIESVEHLPHGVKRTYTNSVNGDFLASYKTIYGVDSEHEVCERFKKA